MVPPSRGAVYVCSGRKRRLFFAILQHGWLRIKSDRVSGWAAVSSGKSKGLKGKVIVIDSGHGGDDLGMIGTKYETIEKELTLSTSFYL